MVALGEGGQFLTNEVPLDCRSGLYGVLRPFDLIRPYRLEMSNALPNAKVAHQPYTLNPQS